MSKHIPSGYAALTPYLILQDAAAFVAFAKAALGATEGAMSFDGDRLSHGELRIEGCLIEVSEARDAFPATGASFHLFVEDPDAAYARALEAGAESMYEPADHGYGERSGGVKDRWGNQWYLAAVTDSEARQGGN